MSLIYLGQQARIEEVEIPKANTLSTVVAIVQGFQVQSNSGKSFQSALKYLLREMQLVGSVVLVGFQYPRTHIPLPNAT